MTERTELEELKATIRAKLLPYDQGKKTYEEIAAEMEPVRQAYGEELFRQALREMRPTAKKGPPRKNKRRKKKA